MALRSGVSAGLLKHNIMTVGCPAPLEGGGKDELLNVTLSQVPDVNFSVQRWEGKTVLGVKIIERACNVHWKALSLLASFVLLQVIHQRNEFRGSPKESDFFTDVRERFVYQHEI